MKSYLISVTFFFHFNFISCGESFSYGDFYVAKSGHSKVKPGEIAVVFYMTVALDSGANSKKIHSKITKCCWIHPGSSSKYDCESMDLHGGLPVSLEPLKKGNITYLFTNLYPLDRVGQCVFHLWHGKNRIAHTIRFNTTYEPKEQESWLGSLYKTVVGEVNKVKVCDTMDLDPRRKCKPVNCVQKYNGKRNFFRKETKLCEPVHECYTSKDSEGLPTTAFDKDHNKCKSLIQKELTRDEERDLKANVESHMEASQRAKFKNIGPSDPIPVRCNHGKRVGEICVCDDGWKTDTSNVPLGDPKFVYNWCNVRTRKKPLLPYKQQKRFMIAGLSLTSITLLVTWLWMIYRYIYPQPEEKQHLKKLPHRNRHVWKKTNLFATSKLINELADKAGRLKKKRVMAEAQFVNNSDTGGISQAAVHGNSIQKGRSGISYIKHFAKNLMSFRSLAKVKSNVTTSGVDIETKVPLLQQSSIDDDGCLSDASVSVQYGSNVSSGGARENTSHISVFEKVVTQESSSSEVSRERSQERRSMLSSEHRSSSLSTKTSPAEILSIPEEVVTQESLSSEISRERSQAKRSMPSSKHRSSSLPAQTFPAVNTVIYQPRSYSLPGQATDQQTSTYGTPSHDKDAMKESGMIVATRTTRAGSIYTLAGPQLMQKRSSPPVVEPISDSE